MYTINRAVVVIKPKQPFLDWVNSTEDEGDEDITLAEIQEDHSVYLVKSYEEIGGHLKVLRVVYDEIFENELWGWCTDESLWPQKRDYATFKKWFDIEAHSLVFDLCEGDIVREEE